MPLHARRAARASAWRALSRVVPCHLLRSQGEEGSVEATVRLNNALGYAEQLEAATTAGSQYSSTFSLSAVQPRLHGSSARLEGRLGQTIRSFQKHSSFTEQARCWLCPPCARCPVLTRPLFPRRLSCAA